MSKVLIIEPEDSVRKGLMQRFNQSGLKVISASDFFQAENLIKEFIPSLVIIDIDGNNPEPLNPLEKLRQDHPQIEVIATAAFGSIEIAVQAIKLGAIDFMLKPFSPLEMVDRVLEHLEGKRTVPEDLHSPRRQKSLMKVVGKSPAIQNILQIVSGISNTNKTVLISGESGVGKSLIASLIHETSRRSDRPLLSINCSAFSDESFLESELFGLSKGAFKGASVPREGIFIKGDGGTVIVDEIGEMPLGTQAKLLSYLESGVIRRVGENMPLNPDTRIIATTKEDLQSFVNEGLFRADLLFRLKNISIEIPSLRSRGEDIPILIKHFLKQFHKRGGPHYRLNKEALSRLCSLPYPGNVLELKNILEQIISVSESETISLETLQKANVVWKQEEEGVLQKVEHMEREIIERVIKKHPRDLYAAAMELGVSRTTLWRRMKKYKMIVREKEAGQ
jgi:DNA-binding NtrC family response regulator